MTNNVAHKSWWQMFEVIVGLPFLLGILLQWIVPLVLPPALLTAALSVIATLLIIVGLVLVILARREFARYRQPTDPGLATSQIITTGVFSISRNPLYLGGICILIGIALFFKLLWALVLLVPSMIACHYILIVPEERYLAAHFGESYTSYTDSVQRWIGRK